MARLNDGIGLQRIRPLLDARGAYLTVLAVDDKPGMVSAALVDDFGAGLFLEKVEVRGVTLPDLPPLDDPPSLTATMPLMVPVAAPTGPARANAAQAPDRVERAIVARDPDEREARERWDGESPSAAELPPNAATPAPDAATHPDPVEKAMVAGDPDEREARERWDGESPSAAELPPNAATPRAAPDDEASPGQAGSETTAPGTAPYRQDSAIETIALGLGGLQQMVAAQSSNLHDWLAVVQLLDQPWTLAYHAIFKKPGHPFPVLSHQAQEISESLGCRAVLVQLDGPDNEIAYRYFSEGRLEEHAHYRPGGALMEFESQKHPRPADDLKSCDDPFDVLCDELELGIPSCFPSRFPQDLMLLSVDPAPARYGRVDLLVLPMAEDTSVMLDDDETLIFQNPELDGHPPLAGSPSPVEPKGFWKNMFEKLFGGP